MDTSGRVWTGPALRVKAKREHRVPLCGLVAKGNLDERAQRRRQGRQPRGAGAERSEA